MGLWVSERLSALGDAIKETWWVRWLLVVWAATGVYDNLGDQFVPKWLADRMPPVRDMIAATTNLLPWWAWGWMLTAIIMAAAIDYAVRIRALDSRVRCRVKVVAVVRIREEPWATSLDGGSMNVEMLEVLDDGDYCVQFKTPVEPRSLHARFAGTDEEVEILERSRHRVKLKRHVGTFRDVVFECAQ